MSRAPQSLVLRGRSFPGGFRHTVTLVHTPDELQFSRIQATAEETFSLKLVEAMDATQPGEPVRRYHKLAICEDGAANLRDPSERQRVAGNLDLESVQVWNGPGGGRLILAKTGSWLRGRRQGYVLIDTTTDEGPIPLSQRSFAELLSCPAAGVRQHAQVHLAAGVIAG